MVTAGAVAHLNQGMHKHYRNHANAIQSHRVGSNTTTNIKYLMGSNGHELDANGYLASKRHSVTGMNNSANLSANSGSKGASFGLG